MSTDINIHSPGMISIGQIAGDVIPPDQLPDGLKDTRLFMELEKTIGIEKAETLLGPGDSPGRTNQTPD